MSVTRLVVGRLVVGRKPRKCFPRGDALC
jgi:hypothetical protein